MKSRTLANRLASSKVLRLGDAYAAIDGHKARGARIVFTNGCFDVLHPGHSRYLAEARKLGDILIVAVNSDRSVRQLKGGGRPIFPQEERAEILGALEAVDYVTIFDDPTPQAVIARMLPHVLVKGAGWGPTEIVGRPEVEAAGGCVVSMPAVPGFSTTGIVSAVQKIFG
ncbi:MAG TPA: adenylyltransferase/cytidyltransferase family protein [Terriglobia bacterium]|nr:adenylyltransferase/cytidyltransferase family protein [Terriglobia bacterium]